MSTKNAQEKKVEQTDVEPIDRSFTISGARRLFLELIQEYAPQVLKSLTSISFDLQAANYIRLKVLKNWANLWNINADWILDIAWETYLYYQHFPDSLENSFEFLVNDIWEKRDELSLPDEIIENLQIRQDAENAKVRFSASSFLLDKFFQAEIPFKEEKPKLVWSPSFVTWDIPDFSEIIKIPKGLRVWEADVEERAFYLKDAEDLIKKELEESIFSDLHNSLKSKLKLAKIEMVENYCNEVVEAYLALRNENGKKLWKKTEKKENLKRNAEWTVKHQILGKSFSEIAKDETKKNQNADGKKLHHSTVLREVKAFLDLIELNEKVERRGRRKGQKESESSYRKLSKNLGILD